MDILCHNVFMERKTAKILGYKVDLLTFEDALGYIMSKSENSSVQTVTINPEMISLAEKNDDFSDVLKNADLIIPDGVGIKIALKFKGIKQQQIPGIEFAKKIIEKCANNNQSIALIGAKEEILQKACSNLQNEYKNLNISYSRNGYFQDNEEREIIDKLKESAPKLVLVALGIPKQEIFIKKYINEFSNTIFVGVGGSFDVWSGEVKRAPILFRKVGCEWLWRLIKTPSRFKRMFPTLPLFLFKVIMEKK